EDEAYEAMAAINDALADEPTHSLARRDARVKAEALERAIKVMRQPMTDGGQPWLIRVEDVQAMAADYRQQAEGGGDE
ncbi:hypothetical protein R0K18_30740, partial [Pantoea sp. SIMBA_133]